MPLVDGAKLGPYEINAPLGAGGMGEVYRAKDTRLGREVAIKILSAEFSSNKDRMDRFAQEARAASALNHPSIITVYDVGDQAGSFYIAMEFIDGKSLRELLQSGSLPVKRMVSIATQIADGLAKAHEAGIVHRDLKPENIMISKDGFAKILDFGLAKSSDQAPAKGGSVLSTALHTSEGTILGTVGYMSPEQAAGRIIDFRSDQFSFGSILYEMLAGKRAFERDSQVQCMSAIIQDEPEPLQTLSPQTPAPLRWIIERCLSKDPAERYASTRDLARELQNIRDHFSDLTSSTAALSQQIAPEVRSHTVRRWLKYLPWLLLTIMTSLFAFWFAREKNAPVTAVTRRLEVSIPPGYQLAHNNPLAMSPDGTAIILVLFDETMQTKLWLRYLDQFDFVTIAGTEGASFPFWSPDSKSIAFFVESDTTLRRLDLASGISQTICKTLRLARGGSWGTDGTILFSPGVNNPIQQVSANGGTPKDVTKLDPKIIDGSHRFPAFLPGGKNFLFTLWSNEAETAARVGGIYVGSLTNGEVRKLSSDSTQAIPVKNNRLLIHRNEALQEVSFDPEKLEITGAIEKITQHPLYFPVSGLLAASASNRGDIAFAYSSGEGTAQLTWVEANGENSTLRQERYGIRNLVIAPDGKQFAAQLSSRSGSEIWVGETERGAMTRLTRGGFDYVGPVWSADGRSVAFTSRASGNEGVFLQPADASRTAELFFAQTDRDFRVRSWSTDGRFMLLESNMKGSNRTEVWMLDVATRKAESIVSDTTASIGAPVLSPDGRWLAYISDESGINQIYIRPYPALNRKWQISQNGVLVQLSFFAQIATNYPPHWRNDGRELLYISLNGSIDAVSIDTQADNLTFGAARVIFKPNFPLLAIAPAPDHTKFLAGIAPGDVTSKPIRVILNAKY